MSGLPFGAAQQRDVPKEVENYEHLVGLEYIEVDDERPWPRSVAYRKTAGGAQMLVRMRTPELDSLDLTREQAQEWISALVRAGLFRWHRSYRPAQGTFVLTGVEWRVEATFDTPRGMKRVKPFQSEGENVFPDGYEEMVGLLVAPASGER